MYPVIHPTADRPRSRTRVLIVLVAAAGMLGGLGACGDGDDDHAAATPRPLNIAEASLMAEVLFHNYEDGGATFEATASLGPDRGEFSLRGDVDWIGIEGMAEVLRSTGDAPITAVAWRQDQVAERRPALDTVLVGRVANQSTPVIVRAPDPTGRRLDQVIAVIVGLAAPQRDNAQLIAQAEGSTFLRHDSLRGRDTIVVRYGQRSVYWIDEITGRLLRFEGTDSSGRSPLIVDLIDHGPRTIEWPERVEAIEATTIADLYSDLEPFNP